MLKPLAYNLIKTDYGDYGRDFDNDILLPSDWCPSEFTKLGKHKMKVKVNLNYFTKVQIVYCKFSKDVYRIYLRKKVVKSLL